MDRINNDSLNTKYLLDPSKSRKSVLRIPNRYFNQILNLTAIPILMISIAAYGMPNSLRTNTFMGLLFFHYIRRSIECFFVHKFAPYSLPISHLYSWALQWSFCWFSRSLVMDSFEKLPVFIFGFLYLFTEVGNAYAHIVLSRLRRKDGEFIKYIPTGFIFNFLTSPNYFFEWLGWIALWGITDFSPPMAFFVFIISCSLISKADNRYQWYRKHFTKGRKRGKWPKKRYVFIPYIW